jgi:hypothetical protein
MIYYQMLERHIKNRTVDFQQSQVMLPKQNVPYEKQIEIENTLKNVALHAKDEETRRKIWGIGNFIVCEENILINSQKDKKKDSLESFSEINSTQITKRHYCLEFKPKKANFSLLTKDTLIHVLSHLRLIDYCYFLACNKFLKGFRNEIESCNSNFAAHILQFTLNVQNSFYSKEKYHQENLKCQEANIEYKEEIGIYYSYRPLMLVNGLLTINNNPTLIYRLDLEIVDIFRMQHSSYFYDDNCLICHKIQQKWKNQNYRYNVCDSCISYNIPKLKYEEGFCKLDDLQIPLFFTFHIENDKKDHFFECCKKAHQELGFGSQREVDSLSLDMLKKHVNKKHWYNVCMTATYPDVCTRVNCDDYSFAHLALIHFAIQDCPNKTNCKITDINHRKYFYHTRKKCPKGVKCMDGSLLHRQSFTH